VGQAVSGVAGSISQDTLYREHVQLVCILYISTTTFNTQKMTYL
jgi:hypothetical protein